MKALLRRFPDGDGLSLPPDLPRSARHPADRRARRSSRPGPYSAAMGGALEVTALTRLLVVPTYRTLLRR